MLKRLHLRNFTVFADAEFEFGAGLNVLIGTNGTGKTHVLKAGYVMLNSLLNRIEDVPSNPQKLKQTHLREKLISTFQPAYSSDEALIRHDSRVKESLLEITIDSSLGNFGYALTFSALKSNALYIPSALENDHKILVNSIFIPAKEVLTLGWLSALYNRFDIPFDKTYPDLLQSLFGPPLRQPEPAHIVEKLAQLIGGKVEEEGGHFYLAAPDQPRLEMNLVAEGMRKFATLYKLLANGTLTPETTLFWDEPEANLNPALLKEMAVILTDLAQAGFQIILATHSLFLMKELHILSRQRKQSVRYFGLYAGEKGDVQVEQQNDFMQLQHIVALDAELAQTFDFDEVLDQDYAGDS